jgi:hypothetical protein
MCRSFLKKPRPRSSFSLVSSIGTRGGRYRISREGESSSPSLRRTPTSTTRPPSQATRRFLWPPPGKSINQVKPLPSQLVSLCFSFRFLLFICTSIISRHHLNFRFGSRVLNSSSRGKRERKIVYKSLEFRSAGEGLTIFFSPSCEIDDSA